MEEWVWGMGPKEGHEDTEGGTVMMGIMLSQLRVSLDIL